MAVLTAAERDQAARRVIKKVFGENNEVANLDHTDVLTLVGVLDDYLDANAATINQAIPQPIRTNASTGVKAFAMAAVAMERAERAGI